MDEPTLRATIARIATLHREEQAATARLYTTPEWQTLKRIQTELHTLMADLPMTDATAALIVEAMPYTLDAIASTPEEETPDASNPS